MAISVGSHHGQRAEINVTPMIDVLLVLIIIFMVITPLVPRGLDALVPQASRDDGGATDSSRAIVITVNRDDTVDLNQEPLTVDALEGRLRILYRNHPSRAIFVRGEKDLEFRQVAQVIDIAHSAGIDRVALMSR